MEALLQITCELVLVSFRAVLGSDLWYGRDHGTVTRNRDISTINFDWCQPRFTWHSNKGHDNFTGRPPWCSAAT